MCDQPATQTQSSIEFPNRSEPRASGRAKSPRVDPGADSLAVATAKQRAKAYVLLANGWHYPDESLGDIFTDLQSSALGPMEFGAPILLDVQRASHARLFGHSVRGSCPPYELEYGRSEIIQQTAELADLTGFYNAFGLHMGDLAFERPDHVSVECEFMGVLCAKESWGLEQGLSEVVETCVDAQRLFLRDHLGRWFPAFAHRVMKAEPESFYGRLASFAAAFIADECRRFDVEIGPQWLELRPVDPARDAAIDCEPAGCSVATGNQLVQIGIESQTGGER